jgi:hypothetical protein
MLSKTSPKSLPALANRKVPGRLFIGGIDQRLTHDGATGVRDPAGRTGLRGGQAVQPRTGRVEDLQVQPQREGP